MKTCFKCNETKPRSEFYRHRMMADGLLGKCKDCTKADVKDHRNDPRYRGRVLAYDRARGNRQPKEYVAMYRALNPDKYAAHTAVANAVRIGKLAKPTQCEKCGGDGLLHGHHDDYSKPLQVEWLCAACHRQHHAAQAA